MADHAPADNSRFDPFTIATTPYKHINNQPIDLHVLIPKNIQPGPHPVIVHFHGGFFVGGHAMYPDWSAQWAIDYQLQHSAIRISANYRLLPESDGLEMMSDISDLWTWIKKDLAPYLKSIGSGVTPDLGRVVVYGESAGGYLAIQSGLLKPDFIKAIIAVYPVTYVDSDWYSKPSTTKSPFGAPQLPKKIYDDHIAAMVPGKIFTGSFPPDRIPLGVVMLQNGLFEERFGKDDSLYPARVLAKTEKGAKMPYLFVLHGRDDTAVPCEDSVKFLGEWKEKFGEGSAVGEFHAGEHGFDGEVGVDGEWMARGLTGVTKAWIG